MTSVCLVLLGHAKMAPHRPDLTGCDFPVQMQLPKIKQEDDGRTPTVMEKMFTNTRNSYIINIVIILITVLVFKVLWQSL